MTTQIESLAVWCAVLIEALGIVVITGVAVFALGRAGYRHMLREDREAIFQELRLRMGRGILLGLEILIAADIITTVAVDLTFEGVGVLGLIVAIRTFLSFSLEMELTGRWPWQSGPSV